MTSYQANCASHHICDHHVGFLLACMTLYRKTQQNVPELFIKFLAQYQIITQSDKNKKHTIDGNFELLCAVNQKFKRFLLCLSIPHHTKRKLSGLAKLCTYRCVPRCANLLFTKNHDLNMDIYEEMQCDIMSKLKMIKG